MSEPEKSYTDFVIGKVNDDLIALEDGHYYFAPKNYGALNADHLRVIADELDRRNKEWNDKVEKEVIKAAASSKIWFSKEQGCVSLAFDEEAWNKAALKSLGLADKVIVPIPKPREHVSFPVACVTGVCFKTEPDNDIYRWSQKRNCLEAWYNNTWHSAAVSVEWFTEVVVAEEPKPKPVWKDCNFIEAVEWMKKHKNQIVAQWEGARYWMSPILDKILREKDNALIYDVAGGDEVNYILGKWQILV